LISGRDGLGFVATSRKISHESLMRVWERPSKWADDEAHTGPGPAGRWNCHRSHVRISDPARRHPFYWAAFVLLGDPS